MKKSISALMAATILAASTMAQGSNVQFSTSTSSDLSKNESPSFKSVGQLKAEKNFLKLNNRAENIRWFENPSGFQVHYLLGEKTGRSYFDNKGRFQYSILTYSEKDLPLEVKKQVKSVYYLDYTITNVTEISHFHEPGKTSYLIQITNGKVWKKVRVADGELELVEEFKAS